MKINFTIFEVLKAGIKHVYRFQNDFAFDFCFTINRFMFQLCSFIANTVVRNYSFLFHSLLQKYHTIFTLFLLFYCKELYFYREQIFVWYDI